MADKILIRRGNKAALPTLADGELAIVKDEKTLYAGIDGKNVNISGSTIYMGTQMNGKGEHSYASCPTVKLNDIYFNTNNWNIYRCTTAGTESAAKWEYEACITAAPIPELEISSFSENTAYIDNPELCQYRVRFVKNGGDKGLDWIGNHTSDGYDVNPSIPAGETALVIFGEPGSIDSQGYAKAILLKP